MDSTSRITACLIVAMVFASQAVFAAGKHEAPATDNARESGLPLVSEPVTLDYFMANHKTAPFSATDLTIAELQKRTNVYLNIISIDIVIYVIFRYFIGDLSANYSI